MMERKLEIHKDKSFRDTVKEAHKVGMREGERGEEREEGGGRRRGRRKEGGRRREGSTPCKSSSFLKSNSIRCRS